MTIPEEEFHGVIDPHSRRTRSGSIREDVEHTDPLDEHDLPILLLEPYCASGVLTQDGVTQIAFHKYKAGEYTYLDNLLNNFWVQCTELLPMTIAPNLVTALGALHCLALYVLSWYYAPEFHTSVPSWVLLFNGYSAFVAYTLDCMDGKQARRTNSSSPLGTLFDHGLDCVCTLSHLAGSFAWAAPAGGTYPQLGAPLLLGVQCLVQFLFFVGTWEEYHTGVLTTAAGQFGVTEVNYGLAIMSLIHGVFTTKQQRDSFYTTPIASWLPAYIANDSPLRTHGHRVIDVFVRPAVALFYQPDKGEEDTVDWLLSNLQVTHVYLGTWLFFLILFIMTYLPRVARHCLQESPNNSSSTDGHSKKALPTNRYRYLAFAVLKLLTPIVLIIAPFVMLTSKQTATVLAQEIRYISLGVGLAFCFLTIKLIVFNMSRQAYAVVQFDALPVIMLSAWIRFDARWKPLGIHLAWQLVCLYYVIRIVVWTKSAIDQICQRLKIPLFTLPATAKKVQ